MIEIAQGLANILELGNISRMEEDAMENNERGYLKSSTE